MRERKFFIALCALALTFALQARAQDDSPPLGDVARQARQQKQKDASSSIADNKDASSKDAQSANSQKPVAPNSDPQNQNKSAPNSTGTATQPGKAKRVITNDEIPSSGGPTGYRPPAPRSANQHTQPGDDQSGDDKTANGQPGAGPKYPASYWTSQIQTQKSAVANLQDQIQQVSDSIQYAGANCVSGCAQWNENQKQKQDQVDSMKAQLEQAQQHLQELQDNARQQGYGSSVYDP